MKKATKRITSVLAAAAMILSAGTAASTLSGINLLPGFNTIASADNSVTYINAQGEAVAVKDSKYQVLTANTTRLTGGYYLAPSGRLDIKNRIEVTDDSYIILSDGAKLIVEGGIGVARNVKFNVYTQEGAQGSLYAGTTTGSNYTAANNDCGIGGNGAKVNLVGGNIYANGGINAYGIEGSDIHIYNTNTTDSVYASSYSTTVQVLGSFVDKKNGAVYNKKNVSAKTLEGVTLKAANVVDQNTYRMDSGVYAVFGTVKIPERVTVLGDVELYLGNNSTLTAEEGITVANGNSLEIYGSNGRLFAGTRNGSNVMADDNCAGIGSDRGGKCGDITINSGEIYANGGRNAAGIGGNGATIKILGGEVNANGGQYGAAIGSGYRDNGSDIKIYGGIVKANGGSSGAGIGSGYGSSTSTISLSYTYANDAIYASSFDGRVSFMKTMYTSDGQVATANNINGKNLTPTAKTFMVYFDSNGAGTIYPKEVVAGKTIGTLPTPQLRGYTFEGWYTDRNLKYRYNEYSAVNSSFTLYAKWSSLTYTVTFDANGGTFTNGYRTDTAKIDPGKSAYTVAPINPTYKRGSDVYEFVQWCYDSAGNRPYYGESINSDTILYASYQLVSKTYTITFDANGGSFRDGYRTNQRQVDSGKSAYTVAPPDPYFSNSSGEFDFDGWCYDSIGNRPYNGEGITSNTTLYASYSWRAPTTCTVTFNANGGRFANGNSVITSEIAYGSYVLTPADPFTLGADFTGWYRDSGCSRPYDFSETLTTELVLYAGWETVTPPQQYTVNFYVNGASYYSATVTEGNCVGDVSAISGYQWVTEGSGRFFSLYENIYDDLALVPYEEYYNTFDSDPSQVGSTFSGGGLIAAIAGGVVALGGGFAAGFAVGKKKKKDE